MFVIDVSYSAVQSGMVATAARTILDSLERIPNKENRTRVAFITVDSALHFYSLNQEAGEPQMLIVSDLEDVFLPQPVDLLANLSENMDAIKGFLEKLPDMFKATACVTNALGSALQAAYKLVVGFSFLLDDTMAHMGPKVYQWWKNHLFAIDITQRWHGSSET